MHLAGDLVVVPDFLGNRSPHADPHARAAIAGLGMERDVESLAALYVAGLLGLGYGLRQIIAVSRSKGAVIETLALSGGAGRHPLVRQLLADCTGLVVTAPRQAEPVLLGSAMLGAVAAGAFPTLEGAMAAMTGEGELYRPATGPIAAAHDRRFAAFETLQRAVREFRGLARRKN
jgi:D-ribulokinase